MSDDHVRRTAAAAAEAAVVDMRQYRTRYRCGQDSGRADRGCDGPTGNGDRDDGTADRTGRDGQRILSLTAAAVRRPGPGPEPDAPAGRRVCTWTECPGGADGRIASSADGMKILFIEKNYLFNYF